MEDISQISPMKVSANFIRDIKAITIEEYWYTGDVRPGRGNQKWLNLLLRKISL